jgi:hypothetical protein
VPCANGKVICQAEMRRCVDSYDPPPELLKKLLVFEDREGNRDILDTLSDIKQILSTSELVEQVTKQPIGWAELLSFLEDLGTVLYPTLRLSPLSSCGIDLKEVAPRVVQRMLEFVTVRMGLELAVRTITYVEWDLSSLQYHVSPIITLEELESGQMDWTFLYKSVVQRK